MRKAGAVIVDPVSTESILKTRNTRRDTGTSSFKSCPSKNAFRAAGYGKATKWKSIEEMLEKTVGRRGLPDRRQVPSTWPSY